MQFKEYTLGIDVLTVHQAFEAQAIRSPNAIALEFEKQQLTYSSLNYRANQLAHYLQALGIVPNQLIGLCVERSLDLIIAVLGILKAGAAYVPLDPNYPTERLDYMLTTAQVNIVITHSHLIHQLPTAEKQLICLDIDDRTIAECSPVNPVNSCSASDLAYVIYTSGSTGMPKGVAMPHAPLLNLIQWQLQHSTVPRGKTLQYAPISFDVSFQEIFATINSGGTLVLISEEQRRDMRSLLWLLNQAQIERLFLPFIALQHLAEVIESDRILPVNLREVITAGEQLRITTAIARWFTQMPHCTLHNHYGPSESHVVTAYTLSGSPCDWPILPPIGYPIPNSQILILDEQLRSVPSGSVGELYIGGVSLAKGYLYRPDLTAARFIRHPFNPQQRLYKTGDLGRYLSDGTIEYLGRTDQQIKVRGYRIEPGEIEAVLERHPIVQEAVVVGHEDIPGCSRLIAYMTPIADLEDVSIDQPSHDSQVLQQFLRSQLPEYMVPSTIVMLNQFPLTSSGKVDRRSLPAPALTHELDNLSTPSTKMEALLLGLWIEVLGVEQIGIEANFWELGGHSLLATQIISRIRDTLRIELPLRCFFEAPTVKQLAHYIETIQAPVSTVLPFQPASDNAHVPLAYVQEPLWFLDRLIPHHPFYNVPEVFRLNGTLNIAALERGFQEIIQRHESLRTTFTIVDGKPIQVVHPALPFKISVIDVRTVQAIQARSARNSAGDTAIVGQANLLKKLTRQLHQATRLYSGEFESRSQKTNPVSQKPALANLDDQAWEWVVQEARRPFNLAQDVLLRVALFKLSPTEHLLLVNLHHIVCDGWSLSILLEELATLYTAFAAGHRSPLPDLPIQYSDFVGWQRQWLQGEVRDQQLAYWQQQLADLPASLPLPTDRPRLPVSTYNGARHFFSLSPSFTQTLKQLSRSEGVTLFMTLFSALQVLLFTYTGQEDIAIGTLVANRQRPELEGLIGFFSNHLVLRTDLSGDPSFRQLLGRVREITLAAYAHQDLPFEQLVQVLHPDRDLNQNPLVQVVFNLQNTPTSAWTVPDLGLTHLPLDNGTVKFDLFLEFTETSEGLSGYFEYSTDLFDADTIERMAGHFQTLLQQVVADPNQALTDICLLTSTELQQLQTWNQTQAEIPQACVHQLFEAQAKRTPDAIAVEFLGESLTYAELNNRSNQLAHYLQALGVKPEAFVGVLVERSLEMVVALLAVLKAGGAYVPLDPAYPPERLAFMIEDSQMPILLTQQHLLDRVSQAQTQVVCLDREGETIRTQAVGNPESQVTPEHLIYLLYTSGSTGRPKAVQLQHRSLVNLLHFMRQQPGMTAQDICFAVSSISFDIAEVEIHLPLITGAKIFLVSRDVATDAARLAQMLEQSGATFMQATPASWQLLLAANWQGSPTLKIVTCGEAINSTLADQLLDRVHSLWNMYAPTEATIHGTLYQLQPGRPVLVGRPISNLQYYVLNLNSQTGKAPQPVPVGVMGEVYIGGIGLARGYLYQPELTAEKFVPHPFGGKIGDRLYKTGDLGRYRPDGNLEIIGRIDHQVKLRGYRIELGDIEVTLSQCPGVREAVVIAREDQPGDRRLVAYGVPNLPLSSAKESLTTIAQTEQLRQWQTVWNQSYSHPAGESVAIDKPMNESMNESMNDSMTHSTFNPTFNPTFNTLTWNSSYTGLPISEPEMREWVDHTVTRILSLQPQRVWEIGCGMGLLLFRVAPHCSEYFGTDLSQAAIDYLQKQLQSQQQGNWPPIRLAVGAADALIPAAAVFDTVILNSVVQYFPSIEYLVTVIEQIVAIMPPEGQILIGDVRSLPLLAAFHTSVQLYQAPDDLPLAQLQQRIQDQIAQERELVIDPACFIALKHHLPRIDRVDIQLKRGRNWNEMSCFRYDVVLHVGRSARPTIAEPLWLNWDPTLNVTTIRQRLQTAAPETFGIRQVQNARTELALATIQQLARTDLHTTVGELRAKLQQAPSLGLDPEDLWRLSQDLPYKVQIHGSRSDQPGCYDVIFQHQSQHSAPAPGLTGSPRSQEPAAADCMRLPWSAYANNPLQEKTTGQLIHQWRAFLKQKLPDYMVPATFVVMEQLPLTPNGKVDRRTLPPPNRERPELQAAFVAPRTSIERRLAEIWAEVLELDRVGIQDNFFELGGHSLLAVQLLTRVQTEFQVAFSLLNVFLAPTITDLAQIIQDHLQARSSWPIAAAPVDLWPEAVLDPVITPASTAIAASQSWEQSLDQPRRVLLTGATGFLGAFLLHELLDQTPADVYCLVRATSLEEASQRLQRNLAQYELWHPDRQHRIIPLVGDLSRPQLGLSDPQFQSLTETIDMIYHNGGLVNFIYPYAVLKAANVLGTQEVLRLASQSRVKPVHFISSLGVFSPLAYQDGQVIQETDPLDRTAGLYGYTQSKWVAEHLIHGAQARGIPTTIHRPAWIEGHSQTGACNQSDFLRGLIKGCIQLGIAPDWPMPIDLAPVDYISHAIVHLSRQLNSMGQTFHFSNPQAITWEQLVAWINDFGYPLQLIPYQQWLTEVVDRVQQDTSHALFPFLPFLTEQIPEQQMSVPELYFCTHSIQFDRQNLIAGLSNTNLTYPPVDHALLATYFSYFIRTGFLPPPQVSV